MISRLKQLIYLAWEIYVALISFRPSDYIISSTKLIIILVMV